MTKVMLTPASDMVIMIVDGQGGYISLTESGVDDCKCCTVGNTCDAITQWRIREIGGKVDQINGGMAMSGMAQLMMEFPQPWAVPHYNQPLPLSLSMVLEVQCKGEWKKIDEWLADVGTCGLTANRWPTKVFAEYGAYTPPAPCNCARDLDGDCADPPMPCPLIWYGSQYYLPNASAYKFTAAVDGEWTNLKNWQDSGGASPARELPNSESAVVIDGILNTIPPGGVAFVNTVLVTANGQIRIPFQASHAEVRGIIGIGSSEACGNGVLVMAGTEAAEFRGDASIEAGAEVNGNANFHDTSRNYGTVTGDATFHDTSYNDSRVDGDATFYDTSSNRGNDGVGKTSTFNWHSYNSGTLYTNNDTEQRNAYFHEESRNTGTVGIYGFAQFDGNSKNQGNVNLVSFTDYSLNDTGGVCLLDAGFAGLSHNDGKVTLKGRFFGYAYNSTSGTVLGGGEFHGSSENRGSVTGVGEFSDYSRNVLGATVDEAVFDAGSVNDGTVTGTARFIQSTHNGATGVVVGDATFDVESHNDGACSADATFKGSAKNSGTVAGTATFFDASNNNGTAGTVVCFTTGTCIPT